MKKWIFMCLIVAAAFANEKEGIYDYYLKNKESMQKSLAPSFTCDLTSNNEVEAVICCAAMCGNAMSPTIIFLDNFFSSYYKLIMKHTPKDKKQELKKIARQAMKKREAISNCKDALSSAAYQICSKDYIGLAYEYGIQELSKYLSRNNPKLLNSIFSRYAKEVKNFKVENDEAELLDKLYMDNIIDETGKLIIKLDSK